jgi:hypothetical protein
MNAATQHPVWCDRQHGTSPTHVADVGDLQVGTDYGFAVHVMHYADKDAPVVATALWTADDDTVVDLTPEQARELGRMLIDAADRTVGKFAMPGAPAEHAFKVSRPYPATFRWACICGHDLIQGMGESAADIHARLLQHVNGEDGLTFCPTGCGRTAGVCQLCPGRVSR